MKPLPVFLTAMVLGLASCAHQAADRSSNSNTSPSYRAGSSASGGSFTQGESKRCESLSGAEKERCDREEGTKTQGAQADTASQSTPSAPPQK